MKTPRANSETVERIKNSQSTSFKKLNPHLFQARPPFASDSAPHIAALAAKTKAKKRIRQSDKPELNKLESEYLIYLKSLLPNAIVYPQSMRFRLGNGIWYKPDLIVSAPSGTLEVFEVKGPHAFRGGLENLKVAAGIYKNIRFFLVWKEGGKWQEQHVLP